MTDTELILKARAFALKAHSDQKYGDKPYKIHLDAVIEVLAELYWLMP